jgi:pilus assembly protein CpaB
VSRRRRAALLLGLALLLGTLAATTVARRESALETQIGPLAEVVVARTDLAAGHRLRPDDLALRRLPARYAPVGAATSAAELVSRPLAVAVARGGFLGPDLLDVGGDRIARPPVRAGERAADVVAEGSPELVIPGARVDVVVTREGTDGAGGGTELALEDVEVLAAGRAPDSGGTRAVSAVPRVEATLRVTVAQAVYLAAAQAFAREVRLLPRAAGDRARHGRLRVEERALR